MHSCLLEQVDNVQVVQEINSFIWEVSMTKEIIEELMFEIEEFESGDLELNDNLEMFNWFFDERGLINVEILHSASDYFLEVKKMYSDAIYDFAEDVIVSLLFDAINGINQYFAKKPKQRRDKWEDKYELIYYKWDTIHEKVKHSDNEKYYYLIYKFHKNHELERQIPKEIFPFSMFSVLSTLHFDGRNLKNLTNKYLGLKSTRSSSGTEVEIFRQSFENHKEFLKALEEYTIKDDINISLTLYQYNFVTNFIDTYLQMFNIEVSEKNKKQDFIIRYSNIPILTWKIEMIKNNNLYSFFEDDVEIKKINLLFEVAKQNLKNMLKEFFVIDKPFSEQNEDEVNFKLDFSIYDLFRKFSYSEKTVDILLEKNKLNLMDQEWYELYTKSYQRNYKKK